MIDYIIDSDTKQEFINYLRDDCSWQFDREKVTKGYIFTTDTCTALLPWKHTDILKQLPENKYNNDLIYGQSSLEGIVSISVHKECLKIYFVDGTTKELPMVYWMMADRPLDRRFKRLHGNLHYKYVRMFGSPGKYYGLKKKYKEKDIYVVNNPVEAAMIYYGLTYFKGLVAKDVSILSFDIEGAGLVCNEKSKTFLITNTMRMTDGEIVRKHFRVDDYDDDDEAMIEDWCKWVIEQNPSIITGHNINGYDLPYLTHCYQNRGETNDTLPLGIGGKPIKIMPYVSSFRVDGNTTWDYNKTLCEGREIIDGMFLAVRYDIGRNYMSWGLKSIIEYEGLERYDRQHYDASKIAKNWYIPEEREKIVEYGKHDSDDSLAIYDIMIPSVFYTAQSVPKPFQVMSESATGSQLNAILVRAYLNDRHSLPAPSESEYVGGGISHGIPGHHRNVFKIDIKSMYPSVIREFRLYSKEKDPKGYFLKMVDYFTELRFEQKALYKKTGDKYYDDLQASQKILINSSYGLNGVKGLNFNDFTVANSITGISRQLIKLTIDWATGKPLQHWMPTYDDKKDAKYDGMFNGRLSYNYNNLISNIDTDSISFYKPGYSEFTKKEQEQLISQVNEIMPGLVEYEHDGYFEHFIVVKAKNYVMQEKGQDKLKMKGSSILDQKKEPALRELMNSFIDNILETEGENLVEIYESYIQEAMNIKDISRWATKKSITKKVLNPGRANEQKVLDAVQHKDIQEGDKVWLFTAIDGMKKKVVKGEVQYDKKGNAKMVENCILKLQEDWQSGEEDKLHYVKRAYDTVKIFENIIDINNFIKYHNKGNKKLLEKLCGI